MKIVIVNSTCKTGSIGKIAYGLYEHLVESGHECMFLHGGTEHYESEDKYLINITTYPEIQAHNKLSYLTGMQGVFSSKATRKAIQYVKAFQPDLIQLFNLHGDYLNIYRFMDAIKKIPTVYGMLDEYPYLGHCCYAFECDLFKFGCVRCREPLQQYPRSLLFRTGKLTHEMKKKSYNAMERIVFTGPKWVIERAETSSLLQNRHLFEVDEYIDTDKTFYPKSVPELRDRLGIPKDGIALLNVAPSNNPRKGVKYYIEAAKMLEETNPQLYFINVGYKGSKDGLPRNYRAVSFVGDQDELANYYSIADLFVCTSLADTMPNTCLDSLACGTPVLGFAITGVPYVAEHPLGEFLEIQNLNDMDISKYLANKLSKSEKKTEDVVRKCREYANKRYSPSVYFRKMDEIYEQMLTKN